MKWNTCVNGSGNEWGHVKKKKIEYEKKIRGKIEVLKIKMQIFTI